MRQPATPLANRSKTGATLRKRTFGVVGLFVVGAMGLVWAWWSYPLLDLRKERLPAVHLYAGGAEIAALQGTDRRSQTWVALRDIPQPVIHAVLAAEDRRFFHHPGIDVRAVLRATVMDVFESAGHRLAILSVSATAHMPDVLEMPYRPDIRGAGQHGELAHTYRLGGVSCLAGDMLGLYSFARPLQAGAALEGEVLAVVLHRFKAE